MWKSKKAELSFLIAAACSFAYAAYEDSKMDKAVYMPWIAAAVVILSSVATLCLILPRVAKKFDSVFDWISRKTGLPSAKSKTEY